MVLVLLGVLLGACGHRSRRALVQPDMPASTQAALGFETTVPTGISWPSALPVDKLQPWEEVDAQGYVIPRERSGEHSASAINEESDFTPGRERFSEAGDVTNLDEASRFTSGASGAEEVSYAIYEVAMGPDQPGALSADVNLRLKDDSTPSAYWLGLSDYANNTWKWKGPFSDSHIRITVPTGDYTSGLGSFFICVVAYDGADFDLVGLGVNPRDDADAEAPAAPSAPTLTPQNGGVLVEWIPIIADDLAGYRLYYADYEFAAPDDAGVQRVNYLEGATRYLLTGVTGTVYVALSAVDISGNESALSELSSADAGAGAAPVIQLTTDVVSGTRGISAQLTATGADTYDFDLDGDGEFDDLAGDPTGTANVNTDAPGIIRPAVRGVDGEGGIAFAAVSLIISVNSRPVAVAHASPASGLAPLDVTFTGEGADEDGTIEEYAWDFDGDGTYDVMEQNPPPHTYSIAGMYNAKLRVTDNDGAFDVDTVAIDAQANPMNQMPIITGIGASPSTTTPYSTVNFTAAADDPDGTIASWAWDFDNDGTDDSTEQNPSNAFDAVGIYNVKLTVTDNDGGYAAGYVTVNVEDAPADIPPNITEVLANPYSGSPPLTVNFTAMANDPDGSIDQWRWDFENDGTWDYTDPSTGNTSHDYTSAGYYTARLRVTDNLGAVSNAYLGISVGGTSNLPPVAELFVSEPVVYLGEVGSETVTLDASYSYDPDSSGSLSYSFDPYGDGNWISNGNDPTYDFAYSITGSFNPRVLVEDDTGEDIDSAQIRIYRFGSITPDSAGAVGQYTSLAVVKGNPAIAYYDQTNGDLKYVRANNANGSSWGTPVTVDSGGVVGSLPSLGVVNGRPAISYYDSSNSDLKYVRASDSSGSGWGTPVTVDSGGSVGSYSSLAVVSGNPAISYYDLGSQDLKYVRANDINGASWGTPLTVDSTGSVGLYGSLAVVNGYPAISYYDGTGKDLKYVRATNANGSTWGTPLTLDTTGDVGWYTSLKVVNSNPAISYFDYSNVDLKYIRATDATGSSWGAAVTVDSAGSVGYHTSLAVIDGNPAISYRAVTNGDPRYVQASDASGSSWGTPIVVDNAGNAGTYTSLAVVNGKPGISYYDITNADLRFAIPRLE